MKRADRLRWGPEDASQLTEQVCGRSWWARRFRGSVRELIEESLLRLPPLPRREEREDALSLQRRHLQQELAACTRAKRAGNPIAIWILINLVLPIVIEIVLNWWLNREVGHGPRAG